MFISSTSLPFSSELHNFLSFPLLCSQRGVWPRRRSWWSQPWLQGGGRGGGGGERKKVVVMASMAEEIGNQADPTMCYVINIVNSQGIWRAENPLVKSLPVFILQVAITLLTFRLLLLILKPLRQPRFIAEILVSTSTLILFIFYNPPFITGQLGRTIKPSSYSPHKSFNNLIKRLVFVTIIYRVRAIKKICFHMIRGFKSLNNDFIF